MDTYDCCVFGNGEVDENYCVGVHVCLLVSADCSVCLLSLCAITECRPVLGLCSW